MAVHFQGTDLNNRLQASRVRQGNNASQLTSTKALKSATHVRFGEKPASQATPKKSKGFFELLFEGIGNILKGIMNFFLSLFTGGKKAKAAKVDKPVSEAKAAPQAAEKEDATEAKVKKEKPVTKTKKTKEGQKSKGNCLNIYP